MAGLDIDGFDWEQCILCQEKTDENTKKDDVERKPPWRIFQNKKVAAILPFFSVRFNSTFQPC